MAEVGFGTILLILVLWVVTMNVLFGKKEGGDG
jgi:hypothetical protein